MADLSVEIAGVRFKNPIIAAGSTVTLTPHNMKKCIEAGAGGIETKSISENEVSLRWQYPGNAFLDRAGHPGEIVTWESAFWSLETSVKYFEEIMPLCKKNDVRMLANLAMEDIMDLRDLGGPAPVVSLDTWEKYIKKYEELGVDVIQIVGPCPIIITDQAPMNPEWYMQWYQDNVPNIIKWAKSVTKRPVAIKQLHEFYPDYIRYAKLIANTDLDIMHTCVCAQGSYIDIENGRVFNPGVLTYDHRASNWALGMMAPLNGGKPIISPGRIQTATHVIERIMSGASAVLVATAIMHDGYQWIPKTLKGVNDFMDRKGYKHISDIIGMAIPTLPKNQEDYSVGGLPDEFSAVMAKCEVPKETTTMSVDEDKCIGCKKCVNVCLFEAPSIQSNGKATINNAICERCGVCPSLCPTKAISLTYADGSKFDFDKF